MWTSPFWMRAPFRGARHKYFDVTDMSREDAESPEKRLITS
jgi:hypothetical protein